MNNVKRLRERAKLTQEQVAQELNVVQPTVAMWEAGANNPRADKLPQLAKTLGCTIDELLSVATESED